MALTRQLHELSLEDINAELEAAGVDKTYKRIDHARSALKKLVDQGQIIYVGPDPFADKAKLTKAAEAPAPKEPKAKKEKVQVTYDWAEQHPMIGHRVFTRWGRRNIEAVGYASNQPEIQKAKLDNGKIVALSSCRTTAVNPEYRSRYAVDKDHKTVSGKPSIGVDDEITEKLKGVNIHELETVAAENGVDYSRWKHLNPGQQRMCLGNRLRGMARNGQRVVVFGHVVAEGGLSEEADESAAA